MILKINGAAVELLQFCSIGTLYNTPPIIILPTRRPLIILLPNYNTSGKTTFATFFEQTCPPDRRAFHLDYTRYVFLRYPEFDDDYPAAIGVIRFAFNRVRHSSIRTDRWISTIRRRVVLYVRRTRYLVGSRHWWPIALLLPLSHSFPLSVRRDDDFGTAWHVAESQDRRSLDAEKHTRDTGGGRERELLRG